MSNALDLTHLMHNEEAENEILNNLLKLTQLISFKLTGIYADACVLVREQMWSNPLNICRTMI
jgi:hypothetical protein